jgi:vanillate O-demethylase ferredoxin subunit
MAGALRVRAVRKEAHDVVSVDLEDAGGGRLPVCTPGAHVRLELAKGLVRQYTLCNGPSDDGSVYRIAVKREPASRGGSAAVHALRPGDEVGFQGPFNHFEVDWTQTHLVLVAAGIGITPIFSMALHARERGHSFEVHYFARSEAQAVFRDRLAAACGDRLAMHVGLDPDGVATRLRAVLADPPAGSGLYVCGPTPFMDVARAIGREAPGIAAVRFESFASASGAAAAADAANAGGVTVTRAGEERSFKVRLAHSGGEYEVAADRSILETLEAAGIDVPCSCRAGECGMCVCEVLEGTPDHRDAFLSEPSKAEGKLIAICVSRAKGPLLVLDL